MANVKAPEIQAAYDDVRNDKTSTNWLLLDYQSDQSDVLSVTASGPGGLTELTGQFKNERASFGYARITYKNDEESERHKFILVIWIGSSVKIMRRAKLSVHSADVKQVIRQFSIEVPANSADDLDEKPIVARLRQAGGASYDKA